MKYSKILTTPPPPPPVDSIKSNPRLFYSLQNQPKVMADILQTQYCSVASDPNSSLIEQTVVGINQGDPRSIHDIDFDKEYMIKAIDEFDAYAATSHDDIPAKMLKDCKHSISTPLTLVWKCYWKLLKSRTISKRSL